jgi:hypothetical protein
VPEEFAPTLDDPLEEPGFGAPLASLELEERVLLQVPLCTHQRRVFWEEHQLDAISLHRLPPRSPCSCCFKQHNTTRNNNKGTKKRDTENPVLQQF